MTPSLCNLCALATSAPVAGHGPSDAKLIVVGEFPNNDDEATGIPFSKSKKAEQARATGLIRSVLTQMGLDPETDVYWVHALRCNSFHRKNYSQDKKSKKSPISDRHVTVCRTHLEADLTGVTAPVVLALGKWAAFSVLGNPHGVAKNRVFPHQVTLAGQSRTVIVSYALNEVDRKSLWNLDENFDRTTRFSPPGSVFWFFKRDLFAVRKALLERGLLPKKETA